MATEEEPRVASSGLIAPVAAASLPALAPTPDVPEDLRALMRQRLRARRMQVRAGMRDQMRRPGARRVARAMLAALAVWIAALAYGFAIAPLGTSGVMLAVAAMIAVFAGLLALPARRPPGVPELRKANLAMLGGRTRDFLEARRALLPSSAQPLLDRIGGELDALTPRLAALDESDPLAHETRRLLGEHLPELIGSYTRVPVALRDAPNAGATPEQQLVGGLDVIAREIGDITGQTARDDLDALATRGRYLETKYVDDPDTPAA